MVTLNAPIVVAVDGSEHAQNALRWAVAAAAREGRMLRVVTAVGTIAAGYAPGVVMTQDVIDAVRDDAHRIVDAAVGAAKAINADVEVTGGLFDGKPALVLREISGRAHMLVVGSRGMGGVAGLLLGRSAPMWPPTPIARSSSSPVSLPYPVRWWSVSTARRRRRPR